jgi:hypothetical protein
MDRVGGVAFGRGVLRYSRNTSSVFPLKWTSDHQFIFGNFFIFKQHNSTIFVFELKDRGSTAIRCFASYFNYVNCSCQSKKKAIILYSF